MDNWLLALFLKPFAAVVLFVGATYIARLVFPYIPAGPAKRFLYDPTLRERHPWKFALAFMGLAWGVMGAIGLYVYW